jgi:dTDP-4-amino-4,6-dideoxygalactose transaminase
MLDSPFSPWPSFTQEEVDAVAAVLRSGRVNYWTGSECRAFEREFADWCGAKYAIALANGTVAIDLSLKALGIGHGDEVIVTPRTFIASGSCIVNAGARPVFADVDVDSQNITAATIEPLLGPRTKAIMCVHFAGWPCDMDSILELARTRNLFVLEDCAQAHGARYRGRSVGAISEVGAWSFCQDKIMTTGGEGGMLTTNDEMIWSRAWAYKDHGKSYEAVYRREHASGFRWLHESCGTNWRMTEMQATIGRIQLRRMPKWHEARSRNARTIMNAARSSLIYRVPDVPQHLEHAWYKAYVYVDASKMRAGWTRDRIIDEFIARGIPCQAGGCAEIYLEKAFDSRGLRPQQRLAGARAVGESALMFLVHPTLASADIEKTCRAIEEVGALAASPAAAIHQTEPYSTSARLSL